MQVLNKVQSASPKETLARSGIQNKKTRANEQAEFHSQLSQANTPSNFQNINPVIQNNVQPDNKNASQLANTDNKEMMSEGSENPTFGASGQAQILNTQDLGSYNKMNPAVEGTNELNPLSFDQPKSGELGRNAVSKFGNTVEGVPSEKDSLNLPKSGSRKAAVAEAIQLKRQDFQPVDSFDALGIDKDFTKSSSPTVLVKTGMTGIQNTVLNSGNMMSPGQNSAVPGAVQDEDNASLKNQNRVGFSQKPKVEVTFSSMDPSRLSNNSVIKNTDKLWYPVQEEPNEDVGAGTISSENAGSGLGISDSAVNDSTLRALLAKSAAERVLKTNLSGSDFVNTLNSTKSANADLAGKMTTLATGEMAERIESLGPQKKAPSASSLKNGSFLQDQKGLSTVGLDSLDLQQNIKLAGSETPINPPIVQVTGKTPGKFGNNTASPSLEGQSKNILNNMGDLRSFKSSGKPLSEEIGMNLMATTGHPGMNKETEKAEASLVQSSGNVVSGTMSRERLSSESLSTLGMNIRGLSVQGGGEIHMRLKPENLGELNIRVSTLGNRVELHIQASNDRSRKIIEESIGYLKDNLTSQNLSLANVDFSVAAHLSDNTDTGQDPRNPQSQNAFQDALGQQDRRGESSSNWGDRGSDRFSSRDAEGLARPMTSRLSEGLGQKYSSSNVARSGRIDVRG